MLEGDPFLPNIMVLASTEERAKLVREVQRFIVDGHWQGGKAGNKGDRAVYKMQTKEAKRRKLPKNRASFQVSHIMLIGDRRFPEEDQTASHLCHQASCIRADHLIWESSDANQRRKRCAKLKKCCCKLAIKCILP